MVSSQQSHDVVVVGGGNAGISLAARLRRDGCRDLAVVEPSPVHHYRPMLSYVGGGMARLDQLRRPQRDVIPKGCHWYADSAVHIDPSRSVVLLSDGRELGYRDVAVCPGSRIDWDAVPGAREAVRAGHAATNYEPELAEQTWRILSRLTAGRAVFTLSNRHVPCAPVGLKPLFLAADHWRRAGVLSGIDIVVLAEGARLVNHDEADRQLRAAAEAYGVEVRLQTALEAVDPESQTLSLTTSQGTEQLRYDALHLTPPHRAPSWIAESGLSSPTSHGFVSVDPATLQHTAYPAVWGLGDAADVDADPSGGALRKQVPVVAHNVAARRTGEPMRRYDGYSVAPVTTSRRRLLLAEFDRDGTPKPTVRWPDLARPRPSTFFFDRYLQDTVYWHRLLKGKVS